MGFLNPLFLLAASALAVPLLLHLLHRHRSRPLVFPALRYLLRTEREHARRIRMRQLLLLLLRCLAIVCLVLAGARPFLRGSGEAHPPTALVIVLDNSLSSSRVVGDERVLDRLKALALSSIELATPGDRIWVLRAGEPWEVVVPGSPSEARVRVAETVSSDTRGDLTATLARARSLAAGAGLESGEVHLLSDLQASAFEDRPVGGEPVPILVYTAETSEAGGSANHYIEALDAAGGLPPLADRRFDVVVGLGGDPGDSAAVPVRLRLAGDVRGATVLAPGNDAVLPVGPFAAGTIAGWAEADPDELAADDRRWISLDVLVPPTVDVAGDAGPFLGEALAVLDAAGRIRRAGGPTDVRFSVAGAGLETPARRRVVVPPSDPALLPALNRRLTEAGVTWRYEPGPVSGDLRVDVSDLPLDLSGVRFSSRYRLAPPPGVPPNEAGTVVARLADGSPWLVSVDGSAGPHLLLAAPLDGQASTLPVDAAMVPLTDWITSGWMRAAPAGTRHTGEPITLPPEATSLELPDGTRVPADGTRQFVATRQAGIYVVLRGDSALAHLALNAPIRESLLEPLSSDGLRDRLDDDVRTVSGPSAWRRAIFIDRQGRELWRPLLLAALVLLLLEGWVAPVRVSESSSAE